MSARPAAEVGRRFSPAIAVLLVALATHLLAVVDYGDDPFRATYVSDALSYDQWAQRLAQGGLENEPVFHQSPLYPLLLAAVYRLGFNDPANAVLLLQALLGSLAMALLVPIGFFYFGSRAVGVAAAAIALLHGPLVFHGLKLLPVSLALATQAGALAALGWARVRPAATTAALAGAAWGLAFLARSETLLFVPFWLAVAVGSLLREGRRPSGDTLRRLALGTLAAGVVVAPVTLHNLRNGDRVLIAASAGENLFVGNQQGADGGHTPLDPRAGDLFSQRELARKLAEEALGVGGLRPSRVSRFWARRALDEIGADLSGWLALEARKAFRTLVASDPADMYSFHLERRRYLPSLFALPIPAIGIWCLALGGMLLAWRRRVGGPPAALAAALFATLMIFFVSSRLRAPLLFVLTPFAGMAVIHGWQRWRARERRPALALLALLVIGACAVDVVSGRPGSRERLRLASVLSVQGRTAESLEVLEPLIRGDRPDPVALDQAGWVHYKRGEVDEAVAYYRRALAGAEGSRRAQIHTRIGLAESARGRYAAARQAYDDAVAADPESAGAHYERAKFRIARGDREGAVADLRRAALLEPEWSEPRAALEALGLPLIAP